MQVYYTNIFALLTKDTRLKWDEGGVHQGPSKCSVDLQYELISLYENWYSNIKLAIKILIVKLFMQGGVQY